MGAAISSSQVNVRSSAPSPSVLDGRLSVVSDALDDFADFDAFWTELLNLIKVPGQMPSHVLMFLKFQGSELVEDSGTDFTTVETYGGIKATKKHYVDKANNVLITETYYESDKVLDNKVILCLHKEPMRIECWGEKTERVSHLLRLDTMMGTVIRGIRSLFSRSKAQLLEGASRDGSGALSCMSEPLQEHGTADEVFEALVQFHRSAPKREWAVKTKIIDPSDTEFTIVEEYPAEVVQALFQRKFTGELNSTSRKCRVDRAERKLSIELRLQDGSHAATGYVIIHDNPVQFEFYHIRADGTREAGDKSGFAQEMLDGALGKEGAFIGLARSNCPSRVSPDVRSAMSDPLDKVSDFETIWGKLSGEFFEEDAQRPDWAESQELVSEDKALGERNFKLILDDGREVHRRRALDAEGGRLSDVYTHEGEAFRSRWCVVHKDPLQLEYWEEQKEGDRHARRSGPLMTIKLQEVLNGLLGFKPPIEIGFNTTESPSNPKLQSIVSDPLDDVLDFDFLWDTIMFCACTMEPRDLIKTVEIVDVKPNAFVFKETYHESFTRTFGRGEDFFTLCILHHEKDRGLITTTRQFNNIRFKHNVKVHKEPLRVEIWQDYDERRHGDTLRALCQVYVDEILRRIGKSNAER